jgi:hypothetical protein
MLICGDFLKAVYGKYIGLFFIEHPKEPEHRDLRLAVNVLSLHPHKGIHRPPGS